MAHAADFPLTDTPYGYANLIRGIRNTASEEAAMTDPETRTYAVEGMTCGHCVASVEEEVGALEGVAAVSAELATGRLEVTGGGFTGEEIRAAVEEAGYELARDR